MHKENRFLALLGMTSRGGSHLEQQLSGGAEISISKKPDLRHTPKARHLRPSANKLRLTTALLQLMCPLELLRQRTRVEILADMCQALLQAMQSFRNILLVGKSDVAPH
jgi:hypothetical protein